MDNPWNLFFFAIILGTFALIGLLSYRGKKAEEKRMAAWETEAKRLGFNFEREANHIRDQLAAFRIFDYGNSRQVLCALSGTYRDTNAYIVDYWTSGSSSHRQTLCIFQSQQFELPHCFLQPDPESSVSDFIVSLLNVQEINFDEDPAFSKAFVLQGADEGAIRQAFTPMIRQAFLQHADSNIQFECLKDTILVHNGTSIQPAKAEQHLAWAYEIKSIFG